jgi:hypothetical protein
MALPCRTQHPDGCAGTPGEETKGAVECGDDRLDQSVVRNVFDDVGTNPQREPTLDVALVPLDQACKPAAARCQFAVGARVADVGDQLLVAELLKFVVGESSEGHGERGPEAQVASRERKLADGSARP